MPKGNYYDLSENAFYLQEYQSFRIGSDGNLQGVGLFINAEPRTGHLVSHTKEIFSLIPLLFICSSTGMISF
jgi:hypothetical protein